MAENSAISWTTHTANFWSGCVKVSALCDHCYAETLSKRWGKEIWGADARRQFHTGVWDDLDKWNRIALETGTRPRVFVMSLGDFFEHLPDEHPDYNRMHATRELVLHNMTAKWTGLDFLLLTKRISNVAKFVPDQWRRGQWPPHVRVGISVGTQPDADRDIPRLLSLPCPNFLSMEPLLEGVELRPTWLHGHAGTGIRRLQWVITGGESGPKARPSHPDWFRSLRDQCVAAGVPFHFKQWGEWIDVGQADYVLRSALSMAPRPDSHSYHFEGFGYVYRVGKTRAGRLLDGRTWNEFPKGEANVPR